MLYDGDTFEHDGHKFRVTFPHDEYLGAPWEEHDGHGIVSEWTRRDKRPGELVLAQDRSSRRYYDFAATVRLARKEGWDAKPYNEGRETRRQQAAKAARSDFEYLRRWCNDQWHWCGVVVELLDDSGDGIGETESVFGIEDDAGEYLEETAHELAGELIYRLANVMAA